MRLLQITDLHLTDKKKCENNRNFKRLIEFIKNNIEKLNFEHVIVTGDISHDGNRESYDLFFSEMDNIGKKFSFFHGNHDNLGELNSFRGTISNAVEFETLHDNKWSVLSVESVVKGKDYGFIEKPALADLEKKLTDLKNNIAIFLHHHVIPVGTPIVDECRLVNADEFMNICLRYNVKLIGTGHAHTLFQQKVGDILISVSPASCSQWRNGTQSIDFVRNSGFSILSLGDYIHIENYLI